MTVGWSPNVHRSLLADPVLAVAVEALRRDQRPGDLYLGRDSLEGPFSARWTAPDGTQRRVIHRDLIDAILLAVEPEVTW